MLFRSALARTDYSPAPDLIYLPEVPFSTEQFIEDVRTLQKTRKNIIIAVSEGIKDKNGHYISATSESVDAFGHKQLCGAGKTLEHTLKDALRCKVRSIELNVPQRAAAHSGSLTDINESVAIGMHAVKSALSGETAKMICCLRTSNFPYKVELFTSDIAAIANKEKTVPVEWITESGNDVTEELLTYLRPLIEGETTIKYKNGIPMYCDISHLHTKGYFNIEKPF